MYSFFIRLKLVCGFSVISNFEITKGPEKWSIKRKFDSFFCFVQKARRQIQAKDNGFRIAWGSIYACFSTVINVSLTRAKSN